MFRTAAGGEHHSLVIGEDGKVIAFGDNRSGQCNIPTKEELNGRKALEVAAGFAHSLVLLDDGSVLAFGWNHRGQCNVPKASELLGRKAMHVAAGVAHSIILLEDGEIIAFGSNQYDQCTIPESHLRGRKIIQVSAFSSHTVLLLDDGIAVAFGAAAYGQCDIPTAEQLRGRKVVQADAGGAHTLLLLEDGSVLAIGLNHHGQCAAPSATQLRGRKVTQVAAGGSHSILLLDDGSVMAMGENYDGQCTVPPAEVLLGRNTSQVAAGRRQSFIRLEDGSVLCFGANEHGQCNPPAADAVDTRGAGPAKSSDVAAETPKRSRHAGGIDEVLYKEIPDFVVTVKPRKRVSEHFKEDVPKAFPDIRPEFIEYYIRMAGVLAGSRIDDGVTKNLEPMEVWAIVVYTMDSRSSGLAGAGASQNFYWQLNKCLQKRDMGVIKHLENYLHFLMRGLQKLDSVQLDLDKDACCLYRGVSNTQLEIIRKKYRAGQNIHWASITSASLDENVARQFASEDGPGGVIFELRAWSAKIIGDISAIPAEREAILLPNFKATVVQGLTWKQGEGMWQVRMIERQTSQAYDF